VTLRTTCPIDGENVVIVGTDTLIVAVNYDVASLMQRFKTL
jgi:hypothetical protein